MTLVAFAQEDIAVPVNATDTLANIKSVLEIPAPSGVPFTVASLDLTFDGVTAGNKPVLVQLCVASATGTFPSSTITPQIESEDPAGYTALITAANVKYGTATVEGTVLSTSGFRKYRLPPTTGVLYQLPLGRGFYVPKAAFFRVRMVATVSVNVTVNVSVNEGGQ